MFDSRTAILTICRDDEFFLRRFVQYYGTLFGRRNLYIISHGDEEMVRDVASGCSIVPVPAIETDKFNLLHWRSKNHIKNALRQWFDHVIVCDVDEYIVVDPATGMNLRTWLDKAKKRTVYTALGLEVVHIREKESDSIENGILGPRRHTQVAHYYSKPCIISKSTRLARGGHYSEHDQLNLPDFLYMFHMKYCDYDLFCETACRRKSFIEEQQAVSDGNRRYNPNWSGKGRDNDKIFLEFSERLVEENFDLSHVRKMMRETWGPRGHNFYHHDKPNYTELYKLPERFAGVDGTAGGHE